MELLIPPSIRIDKLIFYINDVNLDLTKKEANHLSVGFFSDVNSLYFSSISSCSLILISPSFEVDKYEVKLFIKKTE